MKDAIYNEGSTLIAADGVLDTINCGVVNDPGLLFNMLSSFYTNIHLTIPQEYMCNARDAHREIGTPDLPIQVTLPEYNDPMLKIRDFGPSLSPDRIQKVFSVLGKSTKKNTNNETGGFGIGSKCAFAYTETITVIAITDGIKRIYTIAKDDSGLPKINLLCESETDEKQGSEIIIPIERGDIDTICKNVSVVTQHWDVKPTITNKNHDADSFYRKLKIEAHGLRWCLYSEEKKLYHWDERTYQSVSGSPHVILDGIVYPIKSEILKDLPTEHTRLLELNIGIHFKTGEINPLPSREQLRYTKQTQKIIIDQLEDIYNGIQKKIIEKIENCETLFEAQRKWNELDESINTNNIVKSVSWNGHNINGNQLDLPKGASCFIYKRDDYQNNNHRAKKRKEVGYLSYDSSYGETLLLLENEGKQRPLISRLTTVFNDHDYDTVMVLKMYSSDAEDSLNKNNVLEHLKLKNITDYQKSKMNYKRNRKVSKAFILNNTVHGSAQKFWDSYDIDLNNEDEDEIVYVSLYRYNPDYLNNITLKDISIDYDIEIIGIPERFVSKIENVEGFIPLKEKLKEHLDTLVEDAPTLDFKDNKDERRKKSFSSCVESIHLIDFMNEYRDKFKDTELYKFYEYTESLKRNAPILPDYLNKIEHLSNILNIDSPINYIQDTVSKYDQYVNALLEGEDKQKILWQLKSIRLENLYGYYSRTKDENFKEYMIEHIYELVKSLES